jgi:hypothetical protein
MRFERRSACTLALLLLAPRAPAEVVERIPAVVDGRPVLLSEVRLVQLLRGVDEATAVEALVEERIMFGEAARLPQSGVSAEDEERAYASLLEKLPPGSEAAWSELVRRLARRQTAILKYIEFRFRPQVRIDDERLREAYAAEYVSRGDPPPYEEVVDSLRERLVRRDLDERIEAWVRELRAAADVRYNR